MALLVLKDRINQDIAGFLSGHLTLKVVHGFPQQTTIAVRLRHDHALLRKAVRIFEQAFDKPLVIRAACADMNRDFHVVFLFCFLLPQYKGFSGQGNRFRIGDHLCPSKLVRYQQPQSAVT